MDNNQTQDSDAGILTFHINHQITKKVCNIFQRYQIASRVEQILIAGTLMIPKHSKIGQKQNLCIQIS